MRATSITRLILQGLTLVLLHTASTGALARDPVDRVQLPWGVSHQMLPRDSGQTKWICEYMRAPDGVLYMYCEDLTRLLYDEYEPEREAQTGGAKYFPLWSTPKSDRKAIELAERVLCGKHGRCNVELASASRNLRVALF